MISKNKKIRNATTCSNGNITFKSKLEKTAYNILEELGLQPKYEPKTFTVFESFVPSVPFYTKETDKQMEKRTKNTKEIKTKLLTKNNSTVLKISYTPDIYIKYNNLDVWIELKGFCNETYSYRKKLFRKYLEDHYQKGTVIFFEIYSKQQLLNMVQILKENYG